MLGTKWHLTDGERRTDCGGGGGGGVYLQGEGETDRNEAGEEE